MEHTTQAKRLAQRQIQNIQTQTRRQDAAADHTPFTLALLAGGAAGTTVDVALYPLDTLKVRLQSPAGFWKAGGVTGVYNGVLATALGAAPGAAMFFSAYESGKPLLRKLYGGNEHWTQHSLSASLGEVGACLVRVPTGVVTQRMQVGEYSSFLAAVEGIAAKGGLGIFYSGFWTTVAREIPFSFIQFPIYEAAKKWWSARRGKETTPLQGALCGSGAGAIAAAATCPIDVVNTRMRLGAKTASGLSYSSLGTLKSLQTLLAEEGPAALLSGIGPRVGWITVGG